jgi:diguanylate cyclase (GGDEF)-like protein/PAS domain S-box-containing protein
LLKIQIESMPIAFIVLDTQFRVTAWNPAAQKTFGFTAEEALGKSPYELIVSEKVQPHTDEVWSRLLAGKTTVHSVNENLTRDGRTIVCEWSNTLLKDADGRIVAVLSMAQDITERIRTEEALRASEVRYRNLFDRIPVALYRTTPQGEILDANPALVEMLGYPDRETLLGMNVRALYAKPEERIEESSLLERDGLVRGVHLQLRHYDGHAIWARDTARSVCDPGGGVLYYEGSLEDITARKRMEEALLESEQRYHGLFEHSPVSLWEEDFSAVKRYVDRLSETGIVDFRRYFTEHPESVAECISLVQVVDVNHATLGIFQASEKDELLSGLDRVLAIDEQVMFTEELISIAEERSLLEIEGRNRTLNGEVIDVLLRWSVAPGNEDTLSKVLVSITDITRRKQAEESIRRHMARVEALAEISRALSAASLEPQVIFDIIVERTAQLIGDACLLTLISDDREWMQVISYNHRDQRSLSLMREMLTSTQKWGVEGAVGRVISTGQPLLIPVMTPDELQGIAGLEFQACLEVVRIFSLIIVPLVAQGQIIGTLWAWRDHPGDPYIDENQSFLLNLANQTALTIVNARLHELVKYQARTDSLTGIYNRRYFFELAELEFSRSKRHKHALAVIMLDLDRFKEVNDSYGHAAGDQVLRTVADRCRENIRNTDILGRYGGEEFIILLPETNFSGAKNLAERLRRCISEYPIETDAGKIHITVSLGIAINHKNILNLAMLLHNADEALYAGKHAGRNQVAFIGREQK